MTTVKSQRWAVVDESGAVVLSADSITLTARLQRSTPRKVAEREAKNLVNVEAGDRPVHAIRV